MELSALLRNKIDLAFAAIDSARIQAYTEKQRVPLDKDVRQAFNSLDKALDLIESL
jgi:hypothetical protein